MAIFRDSIAMKSILVFALLVALSRGDAEVTEQEGFVPVYPTNVATLKTLKKFVKLVEEHKLNVTAIVSGAEKYKNGNIKVINSLAVTFPVNSVRLTEGTLDKDTGKQFLKLAASESLTASGGLIPAGDGEVKYSTNNKQSEDPSEQPLKLYRYVKKNAAFFRSEDFGAQYTFVVPGPAGNTTTKVLYGDLKFEILKEKNVSEDEKKAFLEAATLAFFSYEYDAAPRVIGAFLDKAIPNKNWNVVLDAEEGSYVNSEKYLVFKNLNIVYAAFSVPEN